jgi:hypothetical protein
MSPPPATIMYISVLPPSQERASPRQRDGRDDEGDHVPGWMTWPSTGVLDRPALLTSTTWISPGTLKFSTGRPSR